jgi:hypothetical protein
METGERDKEVPHAMVFYFILLFYYLYFHFKYYLLLSANHCYCLLL